MDALADRIARHADALERGSRSPLYVALMRGAAGNARTGGLVNDLFLDRGHRGLCRQDGCSA